MNLSPPVHLAYLPVTVVLPGDYAIGLFFPVGRRLGYEIWEQLRLMSIPVKIFFFRLDSSFSVPIYQFLYSTAMH